MEAITERVSYEVAVLSPVHIGSGQALSAHDVAVINGQLWRFDPDRLVEHLANDERRLDRYINEGARVLADWPEEVRRACARYVIPWSGRPPREVREHVADPLGRFYIPGSSVKGAIRTALLWAACFGADEKEQRALRSLIPGGGNPKQAGEKLQKHLLGPDPNHDVLRALRVEDSTPAPLNQVWVAEVRVAVREPNDALTWFVKPGHHVPQADQATSLWAEVLLPRTRLTLSITLDRNLLAGKTALTLGFNRRGELLDHLARHCNRVAHQVAKGEYEWARACGLTPLVRFYAWLSRDMKEYAREGAIYLCLGWGTGWRSKTVTEALGEEAVAQVRRSFKLGKGPLFPKTRRVAFERGEPAIPLGWVRLRPL